jgi:hypothetical protein
MDIPLSDIEQFLAQGWENISVVDLSRLVQSGQTVTIILSDGPFEVPQTLPGGAQTVASKQHTFQSLALVKMRVLRREDVGG